MVNSIIGIEIAPEIADKLEGMWDAFLQQQNIKYQYDIFTTFSSKSYWEGETTPITQVKYKRIAAARDECLSHFGYTCIVCNFNFEDCYGEIGIKFMHVHHLNQIASSNGIHEVIPMRDLRPVCPNCHAMLHRENNRTPLTIEELKSRIAASSLRKE